MIKQRRNNPDFVALAERLSRGARSQLELVDRIYKYVNTAFVYQKDPVGVDIFSPAEVAIDRGFGDCDEQTQLVGILANAMGMRVKLRAVSFRNGRFSHVYPMVFADGRWVAVDVTARRGAGHEVSGQEVMDEPV